MGVDSSADSGGIDRLSKSSALDLVCHPRRVPFHGFLGTRNTGMQDLGIFLASRCTRVRTRRVLTDARFSSSGPFKRVSLGYRYGDLTPSFLAMAWQLVVSYPLTRPLLSIQKPVLSFSRQMVQGVQ
jgi:hypothetical protein